MRQTSYLSLVTILMFVICFTGNAYTASSNKNYKQEAKLTGRRRTNIRLQKRLGDLGHAIDLATLGVTTGIASTVKAIGHPETAGTREATRKSSAEAGENVGGSIGSALGGL